MSVAIATSELARVHAWFDAGRLVRPRVAQRADAVDLVHAVASVCGVEGVDGAANARRLRQRIGSPEHVVFVLIDGLGLALLRHLSRLSGAGFLAGHVAEALEVVFPSTTACVLTSMSTGTYPAEHGVPGWWTYLDEVDATAETLSFVDRFSKRPMREAGARPEDTFVGASMLPRFRHAPLVVTRPYIVGSLYSCWWAGGCDGIGYERIEDGVDIVLARLRDVGRPTYTYLYLNQLDAICHQRGIDDRDTLATFSEIDRALERLHAGLAGRARLIASADHGHVNAADDHVVAHDHPLIATLRSPPSGEARVPVFHVRPGRDDEFRARFADDFGEAFALLARDEVDELRLLGPDPLSPLARRRFGDYLGIAPQPDTLTYVPPGGAVHRNRGVHAGLTPDEMLVPLILA